MGTFLSVAPHVDYAEPVEQTIEDACLINIISIREIEYFLVLLLVEIAGMPFRTEFIEKPDAVCDSEVSDSFILIGIESVQSHACEREV